MKKFFKEFKDFITKGNILDMAIGIIIGGAFSAVVTALANKILMPIINAVLSYITNGQGLYTILFHSQLASDAEIAAATETGTALTIGPDNLYYTRLFYIDWSAFFEAIINFIFIALTLFIILKVVQYVAKKQAELKARLEKSHEGNAEAEPEPAPEPEEPKVDPVVALLEEIRDELKSKEEKK